MKYTAMDITFRQTQRYKAMLTYQLSKETLIGSRRERKEQGDWNTTSKLLNIFIPFYLNSYHKLYLL